MRKQRIATRYGDYYAGELFRENFPDGAFCDILFPILRRAWDRL